MRSRSTKPNQSAMQVATSDWWLNPTNMPDAISDNFDALQHRTAEDVLFLAEHQIDLHSEGECELSSKELAKVRQFVAKIKKHLAGGVA